MTAEWQLSSYQTTLVFLWWCPYDGLCHVSKIQTTFLVLVLFVLLLWSDFLCENTTWPHAGGLHCFIRWKLVLRSNCEQRSCDRRRNKWRSWRTLQRRCYVTRCVRTDGSYRCVIRRVFEWLAASLPLIGSECPQRWTLMNLVLRSRDGEENFKTGRQRTSNERKERGECERREMLMGWRYYSGKNKTGRKT